jgi:hypothetical protein
MLHRLTVSEVRLDVSTSEWSTSSQVVSLFQSGRIVATYVWLDFPKASKDTVVEKQSTNLVSYMYHLYSGTLNFWCAKHVSSRMSAKATSYPSVSQPSHKLPEM